ncbi:MAG: hypothetical protein Q7S52_04930 [bacterium]|nr:hypothetical protein [bacterium]
MAKEKTFDVSVTIVGTSGSPVEKRVSVRTRVTVADVVKAAGITSLEKLNLFVDGKPATAETQVVSSSKVAIRSVKVTERPQGS